jgi:hypothetical protein
MGNDNTGGSRAGLWFWTDFGVMWGSPDYGFAKLRNAGESVNYGSIAVHMRRSFGAKGRRKSLKINRSAKKTGKTAGIDRRICAALKVGAGSDFPFAAPGF